MSKLLLYCTKSKSRLFFDKLKQIFSLGKIKSNNDLNGKIVAECDFEVEEIEFEYTFHKGYSDVSFRTKQLQDNELFNKSCLRYFEMTNYFNRRWIMEEKGNCGYAIHIKNLHIFDEPKELSDFKDRSLNVIKKAPQNMMYAQEVVPYKKELLIKGVLQEIRGNIVNEYILISIQPKWLCLILNRVKDVELRKKVLKNMG